MKKLLLVALAFLAVMTAWGQTVSKNYPFSGFTGVTASSIYDIYITQGDSYQVEVTCSKGMENYLKITCIQNNLRLEADFPRNFFHKERQKLTVRITMPKLESLALSGVANAKISGNFKCDVFTLSMSGSSNLDRINMNANTLKYTISGVSNATVYGKFQNAQGTVTGSSDMAFKADIADLNGSISGATDFSYYGNSINVTLKISGSSDVSLSGKTNLLDVRCMGACELKAKDMKALQVIAATSGSSDCTVFATHSIKATTFGASKIEYYGNPMVSTINKSGSSSIYKR